MGKATRTRKSVYNTHHIFQDVDEVKKAVRHAVLHPYHVSHLYHKEGFLVDLARSTTFEVVTLAVVGLSSLWIAIDIDVNGLRPLDEKPFIFRFAEWFFFVFFTVELLIR